MYRSYHSPVPASIYLSQWFLIKLVMLVFSLKSSGFLKKQIALPGPHKLVPSETCCLVRPVCLPLWERQARPGGPRAAVLTGWRWPREPGHFRRISPRGVVLGEVVSSRTWTEAAVSGSRRSCSLRLVLIPLYFCGLKRKDIH